MGEQKDKNGLLVSIDGTAANISDYDVGELLQQYEIDVDELERFIEQCLITK